MLGSTYNFWKVFFSANAKPFVKNASGGSAQEEIHPKTAFIPLYPFA